jgi:hypothetical protein
MRGSVFGFIQGFLGAGWCGLAGRIPMLTGLGHCGSPKYAQVLKRRVERVENRF